MPQDRVQRRLAAILAADVAGYSRLMEADETGTLTRLKALRHDVVDPEIAVHGGRTVKLMGDGTLVEFASAVEAVTCAVAIQQRLEALNHDAPDGAACELRIGINLGDVIIDGEDIYGDGVNVAARLEALAEPGGILVSRTVRDQIRDRLALALEDLGEQPVKNITRPVRVFRVRWQTPAAATTGTGAAAGGAPDRPSVAVLPFTNMSGDAEQEYFSDGISEDIITDLSKLSGLLVIARNSSFVYKGKAVSIQQASRELGVRYVLEGSVRKAGNRIRVTAQLIDGANGAHLWAERYDRELTDVFAVQDELTRQIVSALALELTPDEAARLDGRATPDLVAYEYFLRGREQVWLHTRAGTAQARDLLEGAIARDATFAAAHAMLAMVNMLDYINAWHERPDACLEEAATLARKAVALDDREPQGHLMLSISHAWRREHDRALAEAERTLALDPNLAMAHVQHGFVRLYSGECEEAIDDFQRATRLDPHYPDTVLHFLALSHFHLARYDEAVALARQRIARNPETDASRVVLAASYGHMGRTAEARETWDEVMRINPDYSLERRRRVLPYKDPAQFEHLVAGLRAAGIAV